MSDGTKFFEALGIDFDGTVFEDYFRKALNESAIPENGAYELLKYLSEKYVVCAASNGPFSSANASAGTCRHGKIF